MYREPPPTVDNLKSLHDSELYQNLLRKFTERSNRKLDNENRNSTVLYSKLVYCHRCYHILGVPFEKVLSSFEKNIDQFLDYQLSVTVFLEAEDKTLKLEKSAWSKSDLISAWGIDTTFLLERFCEFYLLQSGDKERLLRYLIMRNVSYSQKYAAQISKLYHRTVLEN